MSDENRARMPGDSNPEVPEEARPRGVSEHKDQRPQDAEALRRALVGVLRRRRRRQR